MQGKYGSTLIEDQMHDNLVSVELQTEVIAEAELEESVKKYWFCMGFFALLITGIGIVLWPLWLVFGYCLSRGYYDSVSIKLTKRSLYVEEGGICCHCVPRKQKTILLDRIQDVTIREGCLQRCCGVRQLQIETAGQNQSAMGPELVFSGIVNVDDFRQKVLAQRHQYVESGVSGDGLGIQSSNIGFVNSQPALDILSDIRDTLVRIESKDNNAMYPQIKA